jgi:hypothetical protein
MLGSLTGGADCFLERRRGVAGKAPGDGGLRPSTDASICCELEPTESIRGCARTWQRGYRRWGGLGLTGGGEIGRTSSQMPRSTMSDCVSLAASYAGGGKGDGGGECGLLIGVARGRNGRAFTGIEEGD